MRVKKDEIVDLAGPQSLLCRGIALAAIVAVALVLSVPVSAQKVMDNVPSLQKINVEEHRGDTLPLDLTFINEAGKSVELEQYYQDDKPVILILGYYECPKLCNLVFNGMSDVITRLDWELGKQYRIVTVSIDPEETPELAQAKKANYWQTLGTDADPVAWTFLTGSQDQITELAEAVGFEYYYDEARDEYAHAAVITITSPSGMISRYLYGISFKPNDVKFSLMDAADGAVGTPMEKLLLYCFHYDPDAGGYVVFATNVMKLGGVVIVLLVGLFIGIYWLRERRQRGLPPGTRRYDVEEFNKTR